MRRGSGGGGVVSGEKVGLGGGDAYAGWDLLSAEDGAGGGDDAGKAAWSAVGEAKSFSDDGALLFVSPGSNEAVCLFRSLDMAISPTRPNP